MRNLSRIEITFPPIVSNNLRHDLRNQLRNTITIFVVFWMNCSSQKSVFASLITCRPWWQNTVLWLVEITPKARVLHYIKHLLWFLGPYSIRHRLVIIPSQGGNKTLVLRTSRIIEITRKFIFSLWRKWTPTYLRYFSTLVKKCDPYSVSLEGQLLYCGKLSEHVFFPIYRYLSLQRREIHSRNTLNSNFPIQELFCDVDSFYNLSCPHKFCFQH